MTSAYLTSCEIITRGNVQSSLQSSPKFDLQFITFHNFVPCKREEMLRLLSAQMPNVQKSHAPKKDVGKEGEREEEG